MLKTEGLRVFFLTSTPITFCRQDGEIVSGPHIPDAQLRVEESPLIPGGWLASPAGAVCAADLEHLRELVGEEEEGTVVVCGDVQGRALAVEWPRLLCVRPRMTQMVPGAEGGRAAPGVALFKIEDTERPELAALRRVLGY